MIVFLLFLSNTDEGNIIFNAELYLKFDCFCLLLFHKPNICYMLVFLGDVLINIMIIANFCTPIILNLCFLIIDQDLMRKLYTRYVCMCVHWFYALNQPDVVILLHFMQKIKKNSIILYAYFVHIRVTTIHGVVSYKHLTKDGDLIT